MKQIITFLAFIMAVVTGCSEDSPLEEEQYVKQVYIVGADETTNMGMSIVEIPYHDTEEQSTFISVATGGSLNIDRDITVTIEEAGSEPIDDYNFKYRSGEDVLYRPLDPSYYRIPDNKVVIKKGEVYGRMPILIRTADLHCDSLYALTFKIKSVSDPDYISIRSTDTVLIQSYTFVNDYSGIYQSEGYYYQWVDGKAYGDSTSIATTRNFKATDATTVRLFHLAYTETYENIDAYALTFSVGEDNSITVDEWGSLNITDGGGTYDPETSTFSVWYNYESGGAEYQFSGTFIKSED